jgi:hypothetical protein
MIWFASREKWGENNSVLVGHANMLIVSGKAPRWGGSRDLIRSQSVNNGIAKQQAASSTHLSQPRPMDSIRTRRTSALSPRPADADAYG